MSKHETLSQMIKDSRDAISHYKAQLKNVNPSCIDSVKTIQKAMDNEVKNLENLLKKME